MEFEEYKQSVATKIRALSQEEYDMVSSLAEAPVSQVIFSVLGQEVSETIVSAMTPPAAAQPELQAPVEQPMRRAGLGSR